MDNLKNDFVLNFDLNIEKQIKKSNFDYTNGIGIAVSGGADSISLLISLSHFSKKYDVPLFVININHNIREEKESLADSEYVIFVCELLKRQGIKIYSEVITFEKDFVNSVSLERQNGIEEAARFLRYNEFYKFVKKHNLSFICLAHNKDDNLETLLMRFIQGSINEAQLGIPFKRDIFLRPLLNTSRIDIENYLNIQNIGWKTDKTNLSDKYYRNKIRLKLVPFLNENFSGWKNGILNGTEKKYWDNELINSLVPVDEWILKDNFYYMQLKKIKSFDKAIILRLFYNVFTKLNIYKRVPFVFLKEVINNLDINKKFYFENIIIYTDSKYIFVKKNENLATETGFFAIIKDSGVYSFPFGKVCIDITNGLAKLNFESLVIKDVTVPFCIRSRQKGDILITSKNNIKTLSDLFSDWKVLEDEKNKIPLIQELSSSEQKIIFVVGSVLGYKDFKNT